MKLFSRLALAAGLATAFPSLIHAQSFGDDNGAGLGVQVGEPVSAVSIDVDLRSLPVVPEWRPGQSMREAAKRQYHPLESRNPHAPASLRTAPDTLPELQDIWDRMQGPGNEFASRDTRVNINNGSTGVSPGDPVVDVNANYILYGINGSSGTTFTVYNKAGTRISGPTSFKSLAPSGDPCATSVSDPIIHYDRLANRWFMLEMGGTSSANRLCTYVSKTDNPVTGGWWFYGYATPALPDYPHCSVWHNAYVCTANESGSGAKIYAFDRANMLNGNTARAAQRFTSVAKLAGYGFQALTPATFMGDGTNPPPANSAVILARHNDDEAHAGGSANGSVDYIDMYALNINWNSPASSSVSTLPRINITEFNSWFRDYSTFDSVPQPGSSARLDPIREVILNSLTYRNMGSYESLVGNFATNQNPARSGNTVDAGLRWFELRRVGSGNWTLQQEGTFGPGDSSTHHLMGTIATDKQGNIGFGYNVTKTSSPTVSATLRYTGRLAGDPAGVMTQGETDVAVGSAAETSGRWGDYYQIVVDPSDDCTFYLVGSYRPSGSWNTRITDFKFNSCGGTTTTYSISGTVSTGAGVGIAGVTVSRGGASTTTNSSGQYTLSGVADGSYTLTPSLSGYTFAPTSRSVTVNGANISGQNFTGTPVPVNNALSNGVPVNSSVNSTSTNSDFKEFTVAIPSGATNLTIATTNATGDLDLYTRFGQSPGTGSGQYDCRPYTGSGNESCSVASPSAGTYYARVYGYATGNQTFTITASWTVAASTYSISGTITTSGGAGLAGVTVSRGGATTTTNSAGAYSFSNVSNGSYTLTPSLSGYTFTPASRSVSVSGANVSGQNFTASPVTYSISGSITTSGGAGIAGVTVSRGGATTTTNSSGAYSFSGVSNGSYTLTPSLTGYSFAPTSRSVTVSGSNVSGQNFTGTPPSSGNQLSNGVGVNSSVNSASTNSDFKEFTVVMPAGASNLTIATTNASGDLDLYTRFGSSPGTGSGQYDCRPYTGSGNESCSVASPSAGTYYARVYGYATGNQTFTITASWSVGSTTYSISGTITTSGGAGIGGVTVSRGGATTTTTNSAGAYSFSGVANGTYTLTPSLTGYSFSPTSRSVSVSGGNVGGQNFTGTSTSSQTFFENTQNYTINDNSTILSPITVSGLSGNAPSDLEVSVRIIHTYQGDLQVYLLAPDGSSYTLHNRSGGGTDNLIRSYTVNASSESANGTWQLRVRDRANGDTGYLDEWSLQF